MSKFMQVPSKNKATDMQQRSLPSHCSALPLAVDFLSAAEAAAAEADHDYTKDDSALEQLSKVRLTATACSCSS
jgi:hypothetical protein